MSLHRAPLLAKFHPSEANAAASAGALIDWADVSGFGLKPGRGRKLPTLYVIVPTHKPGRGVGEHLLTLQVRNLNARGQMQGLIDVPFRRMRSHAFGHPFGLGRQSLLRRINALLPADEQVSADRLGNDRGSFATINYSAIGTVGQRNALIAVLTWAATEIQS